MQGGPSAFERAGDSSGADPQRARGGCLTAMLVAMIAANSATAIAYFADPVAVSQISPNFSEEIGLLLAACAVLNAFFAVQVFRWRRFGIYGIAVTAAISFAVNLHLGVPVEMSLIGLAGPVALCLLVRPHWEHFK
jgi:hypothetical protein